MRYVLTVLLSLTFTSALHGDYLIGVPLGFLNGMAPLLKINPDTGQYGSISNTGFNSQSLAQDSLGQLYTSFSVNTASNGRIARINPTTGAREQVYNAVTPGAGTIRGLAFDDSDKLYAVVNRDDANFSPTLPDDLYEIDLANQTTQLIGSLGFKSVQGVDVAPNGDFFAWDVEAGLLSVDPTTGLAVDVNIAFDGTTEIQSIVFAPDGRLYGAGFGLFSIDTTTGSFSAIGPTSGFDVRGIEWVVPEPGGTSLSIGLLGLLLRRRP